MIIIPPIIIASLGLSIKGNTYTCLMNEWRMGRLQGCTMVWGGEESGLRYVLAGGHLQGPQKVCGSCALGFGILWAGRRKTNHHIAKVQVNSFTCWWWVCPHQFSGLFLPNSLLIGSISLTDKHFSPSVKIAELNILCSFQFNDNFHLQKNSANSKHKLLCLHNGSI